MKHLSNIKPGDLVRIYDYTHKRREAMRAIAGERAEDRGVYERVTHSRMDGHKFGLILREYPEDSYFPDDYEQYGGSDPDYDREWYVLPIGEVRGSTAEIVVHENRLERMVKE